MNPLFKILFGILLFFPEWLFCQIKTEASHLSQLEKATTDADRVKIYLEASKEYLTKDKSEAKKAAREALILAEKNNYPDLKVLSIQRLADAIRYSENINDLFELDLKAIQYSRHTNNHQILFHSLNAYAKDLLAFNRIPESLEVIEQLKVEQRENNEDQKAQLFFTQGLYNFKLQHLNEAARLFRESLDLSSKTNDKYMVASCRLRLFLTDVYSGVIEDSGIQAAFEAMNYFEANNYPEDKAYAEMVIGDSYRYQGNLVKAYENYSKAYPIAIKLQNHLFASNIQSSYFLGYMLQKRMDEAKNSIALLQGHSAQLNYIVGEGMSKIYLGHYFSTVGEYAKADSAFNQAEVIAAKTNLQTLKSAILLYKTQHLNSQNKAKEADTTALQAYATVQKTFSKEFIENSFKKNAGELTDNKAYQPVEKRLFLDSNFRKSNGFTVLRTMRENSNDSSSINFYQPMLSIFDSSLTVTYNRQLLDIETKYKTRLITDSLNLEQKNSLLAKQKIKNTNIILFSVVLISLLLLTGFALQYKSRKRAERDKAEIQLLQNEIHHRVENNLGVIQRLIDIAGKNAIDEVPLSSLKTRIKSIELLHKHLYSQKANAGNIPLQPYLEDLCVAIAATYETGKNIKIKVNAPEELDSDIAEKLGLIVNELVTNCYKYAFNGRDYGTINITAKKNESGFQLAVEDNGIGFENEKRRSSYGMTLIRGLSNELNGKYFFSNNGGTCFQLNIPV